MGGSLAAGSFFFLFFFAELVMSLLSWTFGDNGTFLRQSIRLSFPPAALADPLPLKTEDALPLFRSVLHKMAPEIYASFFLFLPMLSWGLLLTCPVPVSRDFRPAW